VTAFRTLTSVSALHHSPQYSVPQWQHQHQGESPSSFLLAHRAYRNENSRPPASAPHSPVLRELNLQPPPPQSPPPLQPRLTRPLHLLRQEQSHPPSPQKNLPSQPRAAPPLQPPPAVNAALPRASLTRLPRSKASQHMTGHALTTV
jgi:hypothetical protein